LEYKKNIGEKKYQRGATCHPQGWRARPTPLGAPHYLMGHLAGPRRPSYAIWCVLTWKKIKKKLSGRSATVLRRNMEGTNLGDVLPGELPFGRGKSNPSSSPTILSSGGGQSPSTSSAAPSPLKP